MFARNLLWQAMTGLVLMFWIVTGPMAASSSTPPSTQAPIQSPVQSPVQSPAPTRAQVQVTEVVTGLASPWALAFLPDRSILITEKPGSLRMLSPDGELSEPIGGTPEVEFQGQGGLLEVAVSPHFADDRFVYLSYAESDGKASGTAVGRGRLSDDARQLTDFTVLFQQKPKLSSGHHFGGRMVFGHDGMLYVTLGEHNQRSTAQDLDKHQGTIVRIHPDGSVPSDNPFVQQAGALPEIWSYGHRNPQGLALDAGGRLWLNEHGARGGDEVNLVAKGANYGWPVIAYGRHYSGLRIGEGTAKPGMEQPVLYWDPSIAPSGMAIYTGDLLPDWRGQVFVGSLKFDYIARLAGDPLSELEQIKGAQTDRVRDVRQAPDGSLWFISEGQGTVYRIAPKGR